MSGKADGVARTHVRKPPQTNAGRNGKTNLLQTARAFNRNAHKVCASRVTKPEDRTFEGKNLSSRKIDWLEKLEHRWNIFECSFRLALHIYLDNEGRAALKNAKEASKARLSILQNKETRRQESSAFHEAVVDGQPVEGLRRAKKVGGAVIGEGVSRVRELLHKS